MIYADNAATTKLDKEAFEAMSPFLLEEYGNASQPYFFSKGAKKALSESRSRIAECLGANPEEIFFTSCGTESDNWAIKIGSQRGKHIVTTEIEHHAVLNSCLALEKQGKTVTYLPVSKTGEVDPKIVEASILDDTGIVSIMFANNEIGTVQPIAELVRIAHKKNVLFHTDAVQAVGHIKIDVHSDDVDLLSASAHKFNGPKGIGFLYIKKGIDIAPFINGGLQEKGLRAGTENVASIVAMSIALKNNFQEIENNRKHLEKLEEILLGRLSQAKIDFIRNGSSNGIPGNISLSFRNSEGEMLLHRLDLQGICISTGSACNSQSTQLSHVIKAIAVPDDYSKGTIRISFGKYNTVEEAEKIALALIKITT